MFTSEELLILWEIVSAHVDNDPEDYFADDEPIPDSSRMSLLEPLMMKLHDLCKGDSNG